MFNVGGGELLVILLIALIVLGPQRLPDAARQMGKVMGEVRRVSAGFQQEMKDAFEDVDGGSRTRRTEATPLAATVADVERRTPVDDDGPVDEAQVTDVDEGADVTGEGAAPSTVGGPASSDASTVAPAVAAALDEIVSLPEPPVDDVQASDPPPRPDGDALGGERAAS
jgi:sec-independent protein translocase protein TatB